MACDCENPCRECKGNGSECSMDPAECGHAGLPSSDNLLERAFMARIRADEYREALAALQREFDERPDVIEIKRLIDRCEEERRQAIAKAKAAGISKMGSFVLKERTRTVRTVIPWRFAEKFGLERFCRVANIPVGVAEKEVGKIDLEDVCEKSVTVTGVSVEYERPEVQP